MGVSSGGEGFHIVCLSCFSAGGERERERSHSQKTGPCAKCSGHTV
ncbi:hypothetical protein B005_0382 [Nocardiopsis alba ATCC BAA-2165]|uniref:Uncharacterized protein n=1 Tax=Nocardiopsis alba (strain ATCC BAA-2165 / BE74) TaxID=1205910 RepID=J7LH74_NOCAA|nr:hypothetical protein B005_0382 [Nocardiopsis alba ATCC BAA-2165]